MKFSRVVYFISIGIAAVSAMPTGHAFMKRECELKKCVVALSPIVVSCGSAAAKKGLDGWADATCLAAAYNAHVNIPAPCQGCDAELAEKFPGYKQKALDVAKDVAGNVVDEAKSGLSAIKEDLGDIF